eukprot:CAMPEP_0195525992 /NCGR_PEP_ID=MMETSP0794_2-20130614/26771_1 /TAXON_ID=515487 /ORGANISM="Stephanopyxis turris, Strain CCMP 815" /LENGTH=236 /DNA_ID=CAMNT_0040656585 /DNA_START=99 /DNA_END=809 /DNA_ORIENTATION=-
MPPQCSNMLRQATSLTNKFYSLRHGQSLANVEKIISSNPDVATVKHGLSDIGREQARNAGEKFILPNTPLLRGAAIFSSDFTRARETANIFADALSSSNIPLYKEGVIFEKRLRERSFGDLDGGPDSEYNRVWEVDALDPNHVQFQVESVNSVVQRTTELILEIDEELKLAAAEEEKYDSRNDNPLLSPYWACILVAHGDVLQILQTGFEKMDGSLHRTLPHLETATLRELILADK